MKISLGAAERDFLRYSVILTRILPLSVLTLHVPVPLLNGTSVLLVLNVPVTLPLKLSLRKCRSRDRLPRKRLFAVSLFALFPLWYGSHRGAAGSAFHRCQIITNFGNDQNIKRKCQGVSKKNRHGVPAFGVNWFKIHPKVCLGNGKGVVAFVSFRRPCR